MLFRPNLSCTIIKKGERDGYGQLQPGRSLREKCAVIELNLMAQRTSVRADQSASRGAGEEEVVESTLLLPVGTAAKIDDGIVIGTVQLRITAMNPRFSIRGALDHYVVRGVVWKGDF